MKLWIPGGRGVLGSALEAVCKEKKITTIATGKEIDVADEGVCRRFIERARPTQILNCAAYTAVDLAEKEQERAFAVNALGPENLGKLARAFSLPLLHLSTNYIFDGKAKIPYEESAPANPLGIYGKSKWEGETRLRSIYPEACIVRTSWVFGKEGKNFVSSLLQTFKKEKIVHAATDQSGRITYTRDLAIALLQLLGEKGVFHFANRGAVSRYEIAQAVLDSARGRGIPLLTQEIIPTLASAFVTAAPRPEMGVLATEKVEKKIRIRAWQEALEEYIHHAI